MNENDDNFEAELRSLRPAPPSPHLKQEIAQQLQPSPRYTTILVAIAAAAALIVLTATLWFTRPVDSPAQPQQPQIVESRPSQDNVLAQLSAWRYHQVARQSPRELIRLLDEQAAQAPAIGGPTPTVHQLLESNS